MTPALRFTVCQLARECDGRRCQDCGVRVRFLRCARCRSLADKHFAANRKYRDSAKGRRMEATYSTRYPDVKARDRDYQHKRYWTHKKETTHAAP